MKDLDILHALRNRMAKVLVANGFATDVCSNIMLGKVFDPQSDALPAVIITQPEDDADVVDDDETATMLRMTSTFVLEAWCECDRNDPLPDLMVLRGDLVRGVYMPSIDSTDALDGVATALRLISTAKFAPTPGSNIGMTQVTLRIEYFQSIGE